MPNDNFFSLTVSTHVADICRIFFEKTNLNAFSYSRVYPDGSRAELWTDAAALVHTFITKPYIVGAYTPKYYYEKERYILLEQKIPDFEKKDRQNYYSQVSDQKNLFNHAYPFKIVNQLQDFCEYFIFYAPASEGSVINFYLNHLDELENFCKFFQEKAASLIYQASSHRLIKGFVDLKPKKPFFVGNLTERQVEISEYLLSGLTHKKIAEQLGLSPRTVDSHIENLKYKLKCFNKSELVIQLLKVGSKPFVE